MNKNTKRIRAIVRKDGKDGNHETILLVPAKVVSINEDAHGRKDSRTTHEILTAGKFANLKNKHRTYASMTDANKR